MLRGRGRSAGSLLSGLLWRGAGPRLQSQGPDHPMYIQANQWFEPRRILNPGPDHPKHTGLSLSTNQGATGTISALSIRKNHSNLLPRNVKDAKMEQYGPRPGSWRDHCLHIQSVAGNSPGADFEGNGRTRGSAIWLHRRCPRSFQVLSRFQCLSTFLHDCAILKSPTNTLLRCFLHPQLQADQFCISRVNDVLGRLTFD